MVSPVEGYHGVKLCMKKIEFMEIDMSIYIYRTLFNKKWTLAKYVPLNCILGCLGISSIKRDRVCYVRPEESLYSYRRTFVGAILMGLFSARRLTRDMDAVGCSVQCSVFAAC